MMASSSDSKPRLSGSSNGSTRHLPVLKNPRLGPYEYYAKPSATTSAPSTDSPHGSDSKHAWEGRDENDSDSEQSPFEAWQYHKSQVAVAVEEFEPHYFTVEKGRSMKMDSIRRAVVSNEKQKNNAVVSNEKQKKDACICY